MLGFGLANFIEDEKPDKGEDRSYRKIVSETVFFIWKMKNRRRIRDNHSGNSVDLDESKVEARSGTERRQ